MGFPGSPWDNLGQYYSTSGIPMLKRLYVDNYKTFSNFELELESLSFFLGANGSGKSSVFEVLVHLRLLLEGESAGLIFRPDTSTRWDARKRQTFELEFSADERNYRYRLEIEHSEDGAGTRIAEEHLELDGATLISFVDGEIAVFGGAPTFSVDPSRSAVSIIGNSEQYEDIHRFRELINRIYVFKPNPTVMQGTSVKERKRPGIGLKHFGSWYRYLLAEKPGTMHKIGIALEDAIPGFCELKFEDRGGNRRELVLQRATDLGGQSKRTDSYRFDELSDGEKLLIGLYTVVMALAPAPGTLVCIDEPLNHISLVELEPLLAEIEESYAYAKPAHSQMFLASHHPFLVDFFARRFGFHFKRENAGPTTARPFKPSEDSKLSTSEVFREGWERL